MACFFEPFQRLTSNTSTVFLGTNMAQAAINAANATGENAELVPRNFNPTWPSLKKFKNDTSLEAFSPFGAISDPQYIWDPPTSDGQTAAFAVASSSFVILPFWNKRSFSVFLAAFADNAIETKIEIFEQVGSDNPFVKTSPQPAGLGDVTFLAGEPNTPAVGLIETQPFNWQDIHLYSSNFELTEARLYKIVVSFEVTNYLIQPPGSSNPAGLQFLVDIYSNIDVG